MVLIDVFKVPTLVSLGVIATLIGGAVALSLLRPPRKHANGEDRRGETAGFGSHGGEAAVERAETAA
jgi:hypothetical protein